MKSVVPKPETLPINTNLQLEHLLNLTCDVVYVDLLPTAPSRLLVANLLCVYMLYVLF